MTSPGELVLRLFDNQSANPLQHLVDCLRQEFDSGAVVLLELSDGFLRPLAQTGLVREAFGRSFDPASHPRLATILARSTTSWFEPDCDLPDPYDGLLPSNPGNPLHVHDCMGIRLEIGSSVWGAMTFDSLRIGTFTSEVREQILKLRPVIEHVIKTYIAEEESKRLRLACINRDATRLSSTPSPAELLGSSESFTTALNELTAVAASNLPVLITGETGSGKELFARRVHQMSARANQPLIYVNCAALPESLVESELFGHIKGAFTGAIADRIGRFDAAHLGTIFLDEVGELPTATQAKLLRVLQNGEVQKIGRNDPHIVDVRIIAATNRNLLESTRSGGFRTDLYHRLSVYPIRVPPLRERGSDVLTLAGHFLELNRTRFGLRSLRLSHESEDALLAYHWPGNVRELEHTISRATLKALKYTVPDSGIITIAQQFLDLNDQPITGVDDKRSSTPGAQRSVSRSLKESVDTYQKNLIHQVLEENDGNWSKTATQLKIDASNLHKLAKRLRIK